MYQLSCGTVKYGELLTSRLDEARVQVAHCCHSCRRWPCSLALSRLPLAAAFLSSHAMSQEWVGTFVNSTAGLGAYFVPPSCSRSAGHVGYHQLLFRVAAAQSALFAASQLGCILCYRLCAPAVEHRSGGRICHAGCPSSGWQGTHDPETTEGTGEELAERCLRLAPSQSLGAAPRSAGVCLVAQMVPSCQFHQLTELPVR